MLARAASRQALDRHFLVSSIGMMGMDVILVRVEGVVGMTEQSGVEY